MLAGVASLCKDFQITQKDMITKIGQADPPVRVLWGTYQDAADVSCGLTVTLQVRLTPSTLTVIVAVPFLWA